MKLGYFVSHGSPTILVEDVKWKRTLASLGKEIKEKVNPEVVVVASPHFFTFSDVHYVEVSEKLECIQDYYGFPDELYKFCYSAENDVGFARKIAELSHGKFVEDRSWGLDHGAWIPLYYMFPEGGVKVVTVSINEGSPEEHYRLGEVIAKAVDVLGRRAVFLATGSPTHRFDLFYFKVEPRPSKFDLLLVDLLKQGKFEEIMRAKELYPREWKGAMPEGELNTMYMLMGFVKPKRAEVIDFDVPWTGVSMLATAFYG
ncbi:MAG: dioxygenase [Candidatus Aramenus sp.]|jgi:aromatic ring-opening dioxygenase catalytic subunit (LigB family)|nr:dioxygenase [Candidatus Aramenus sp.]